ncbi:hypothetical protein [Mucilaginibacter endophyticus]|uniref:hypothetical protein n=1 Tax=Mucilaginibacter endophyticus TaxID=2675003 RepID=UPI000E0D8B95|nr:hypothetical protein [Mucilaginibacter endophyticus]
MRTIIKRLHNFLEETIDPQNLIQKGVDETDIRTCSAFILENTSVLQRKIQYRLDRADLSQEHVLRLLRTLTSLSNRVFNFLSHRSLAGHPSGQMIRNLYKVSCNKIENILTLLNLFADRKIVPVSDFAVQAAVMRLKEMRQQFESCLTGADLDPVLKEMTLFSLGHSIRKIGITWDDCYSLETLMTLLSRERNYSTTSLINALIRHNFNTPEFFLYCTRMWRNALLETGSLEQQLEIVISEKHRIYELSVEGKQIVADGGKTIAAELREYLYEQYLYLKHLLKLRKSMHQEKENATQITKFPVNLSVPQFGLFIRLQIEKGILPKERVGQLFNFFATHFYTAGARHISAESLQKKSTDVEFATARQMKGQLIAMLNWLNANYNLSNYS